MKIEKIEKKDTKGWNSTYLVTFKPNWLEKIFGVKEKQKEYKDTGSTYTFGGGTVYIDKDGEKLGNEDWIAEAIDKWRRKF